jgi:hypothetical protein
LERLKTLRLRAGENLHKAQVRYKKSYDREVVRKNTELSVGDEACSTMGDRAYIAFGDRSTWPLPDCFLGHSLFFPCYISCLVLVICCQYLVMDVIPLF